MGAGALWMDSGQRRRFHRSLDGHAIMASVLAFLFQLKTYVAARAWLVVLLTFVLAATGLMQNPTRRVDASGPGDTLTRPALKLKVRAAYRSKPVTRYGSRGLGEVTTRRNVAHGKPHVPSLASVPQPSAALGIAVTIPSLMSSSPWAAPRLVAGSAHGGDRRPRAPPLPPFLA